MFASLFLPLDLKVFLVLPPFFTVPLLKRKPVKPVFFAGTVPILKTIKQCRTELQIQRLATSGPGVSIDNPESSGQHQSQPVCFEDSPESLPLECRQHGVGITVDGVTPFSVCQSGQALDRFIPARKRNSIGFACEGPVRQHPNEDCVRRISQVLLV